MLPSLDETPTRISTLNKSLQTISASLFLGDIVNLEDHAGFASFASALEPGLFGLLAYRSYTQPPGTDVFITSVRLGEEELGIFQPGFDETQTISGDETIDAVFTQLQDAFNYAHIFRGTQGKLTFDLYVDSLRRDLAPFNWTDAQLLAIPDDELLRLVNSEADVLKPANFDDPDDPGNDADTFVYKTARDFQVGRKLIIKWRSDDGEPVTVKGDTLGGVFIPYFETYFANRFLDRSYLDRHLTQSEAVTIDTPYINIIVDPTAASFDFVLLDATTVEAATITTKLILGATNTVTLKPEAGQTIEGEAEYVLSGLLAPSVTMFSDGTTDWKIASIYDKELNIGSFHMHNNALVTAISALNTNTDITGAATASLLNSNFTFTTNPNILTYTGLKDITGMLTITASMSKANSSDKVYRIVGIKDGAEIEGCNIATNVLKAMIEVSVSYPVALITDNDIKTMVRMETGPIEDIDVTDLIVTFNEISK